MMTIPDSPVSSCFWRQDVAARVLTSARERERLARSYLFVGPEGVGKWAAAQWVGQAVLCTRPDPGGRPCGSCEACLRVRQGKHPDCHTLFPVPKSTADMDTAAFLEAKTADPFAVVQFEKKPNLAIDRVRDLITELSKTSVEGGSKVAIIASADQMMGDAQAILLKSIEEPPTGTFFVLTSSDPGRILPTVLSRCQVIRFAPVDPAAVAERLRTEGLTDPSDAELVAQLCGGGWGKAVQLTNESAKSWRLEVAGFWNTAFTVKPGEMLTRIEALFRKRGYDDATQAFDLWKLLLRSECATADSAQVPVVAGVRIDDLETVWSCWKILENGCSTLRVNVVPRSAVRGTFLKLRRRLRCD